MRSVLIEFHRFNNLTTGSLRKGDPYLIAAGRQPVRQCQMSLDHAPFLDLMRGLRYQGGAAQREEALKELSGAVTTLLGTGSLPDIETGEFPVQLDLVVNASELAALPFEAVTDAAGQPLLVRAERPIELARRVRHDFAETAVRWPAKPRVLFAWASPPGVKAVPHQEHEAALRTALERWLPVLAAGAPDNSGVLTILAEAGIDALAKACADSVSAKTPFTHVHLLAHGYPVGLAHRQQFGMALHAPDGSLDAVPPEKVTEALAPLRGHAFVVTMATCDAANEANTLIPEKSIAHDLHVFGFPVVVASQLPFTVPGSTLMVQRFYGALLGGADARSALHDARLALHASRNTTGHDWVSLVGYVRLPEGYAEHLASVRLEAVLASLKNAQARSDEVVKSGIAQLQVLDDVARLLGQRIAELEGFGKDPAAARITGVLEENLGLLGSAEKRLAELNFERGKAGAGDEARGKMREALQRSRDWYQRGFERNLSHHWTGVQYLSLESVLTGRIEDPAHWHACVLAARVDSAKARPYWAHGSLTELFLLAPLAGQPVQEAAAVAALEALCKSVAAAGIDTFPLESTERQLRRYVSWWTTANGFFPKRLDLADQAGRLLVVLRRT